MKCHCNMSIWYLVDSPHKDQWRGALIFSLICAWTNGWANNRDAGDLRRHRAHYDVIVMSIVIIKRFLLKIHWYEILWLLLTLSRHWLRGASVSPNNQKLQPKEIYDPIGCQQATLGSSNVADISPFINHSWVSRKLANGNVIFRCILL